MITRRRFLNLGTASVSLLSVSRPSFGVSAGGDNPIAVELAFGERELLAEGDGLRIVRQHWRLGREGGFAWCVSAPRNASVTVVPSERVEPLTSMLPSSSGAWAAINGAFYNPAGRAMGAVIADGVVHAPYRRGGGSGILQVTDRGVEIVHHSGFSRDALHALQSIDRIVAQGRPLVNVRPGAGTSARSAVALTEREIVLALVAGERSVVGTGDDLTLGVLSGHGMPLWAFSRYLVAAVGVTSALNLDGGVSAQMAADIAGRRFRIRGLRGTINALLVRPRSTGH